MKIFGSDYFHDLCENTFFLSFVKWLIYAVKILCKNRHTKRKSNAIYKLTIVRKNNLYYKDESVICVKFY